MSAPPKTYAQWAGYVSRFATGDDDAAVFATLAQGRYVPSAGAGERMMQRVADAVHVRLLAIATRMQMRFNRASGDDAVVAVLHDARREIDAVRAFADLRCWPGEVRSTLGSGIEDFARKTQASLEESAERNGHVDRGRMASLLRRAPLVFPVPEPPTLGPLARLRDAMRTYFISRGRPRA